MRSAFFRTVAALVLGMSGPGCGGQTGEFDPPDSCGRRARQVKLTERLPEIGMSVKEATAHLRSLTLDEVRFVPFTGQAGWNPDAIESVACGVGLVTIEAIESSDMQANVHDSPDSVCANEISFDARITATSEDGAIAETMEGNVALYFDAKELPRPSTVTAFAEQPLSQMRGTARPREDLASGSDPKDGAMPVEPTFRIDFRAGDQTFHASLEFHVPSGGTQRHAEWRNACPAGPTARP